MELKDLFVSYKQVDPIEQLDINANVPEPIYINLNRAQRAIERNNDDDMSSWSVGNDNDLQLDWRVKTQTNPKKLENATEDVPAQKSRSVSPISPTPVKNNSKPKNYTNAQQLWIDDMTEAYARAGLNDNAIKNLLAKNALESGWGKYTQGSFNFGNITTGGSWRGAYVDGKDTDAKGNPIRNRFRSYNNLDEFVKDEIQFLTSLYDFDPNDDIDTFLGKLQGSNSGKRHYAEDPNYKKRVKNVYSKLG